MRTLLASIAALSMFAIACTDPEPLPGPACDDPRRPEFCKNACADDTCPGAVQATCERECRACDVEDNYCPAPAP